jgi:hypothetical protein
MLREARWNAWRQRREWRRELKDVPLHQLRANVERQAYYQNPAKQRWVSRWVWRRERLWGNPLALVSAIVAVLALIASWRWLF